MDLKTRLEVLPCGKCEDMMDCDLCLFQKEAKELYQQIRADAIDEIIKLVDDDLTCDIGMDLFVNRDLLCERLEKLKEKNNDL